jgi:Asp-tRNAAsn/Glu-tRNAGln amidotransferase A subunit and related amidases
MPLQSKPCLVPRLSRCRIPSTGIRGGTMPRFALPPVLGFDLFRKADADTLLRLYRELFLRVAASEGELFIFAEGGFRPKVVLDDLDEALRRWPDAAGRPPLFGVPVGIKDVFRTSGYAIRCGSLLPSALFAGDEAPLVTRLREAGAIVMGITATTEFTHAEPAATRNPCNKRHTPGGSSSGSAAGVRAGYFALALGTQTMGSVVRPAAFCGVKGLKPSQGLLPGQGIINFSPSLDQPGFFCATTQDAATTLSLFCDTQARGRKASTLFVVPEGAYMSEAEPAMRRAFDHYCDRLARLPGVRVMSMPVFDDWQGVYNCHQQLAAAELAQMHNAWFADFGPLYRPKTREFIELGQTLGEGVIEAGRASCAGLRKKLDDLLAGMKADAFLAPAAPGEAPKGFVSTGNPVMNVPWTHAGLPVLCLPMDTVRGGLPLGVQTAGRFGCDAELMALAPLLETAAAPVSSSPLP